jgi:hypothetical protein
MAFDLERMCRLNGKRPTARERWTAFYRLWRLARKAERANNLMCEAVDALRVLGYAKWVALCEDSGDRLGLGNMLPPVLRRRFLEIARKRRLYGQHYEEWDEWRPRDQAVARQMCEQGIEYTPDQAAEARKQCTKKIRAYYARIGIQLPESDLELFKWWKRGKDEAS